MALGIELEQNLNMGEDLRKKKKNHILAEDDYQIE
jgi:hypothetical protein